MSYAPIVAPDAFVDWQSLPVDLQEAVWDQLDAVSANPPQFSPFVVRQTLNVDVDGVPHHLHIRLIIDSRAQTVTVIGIKLEMR